MLRADSRHAAKTMKTQILYCFLWQFDSELLCMNRSDWASWVQAVGSLIGLGIAVAIPITQAVIRSRAAKRNASERKARALAVAQSCFLDTQLQIRSRAQHFEMRHYKPHLPDWWNTIYIDRAQDLAARTFDLESSGFVCGQLRQLAIVLESFNNAFSRGVDTFRSETPNWDTQQQQAVNLLIEKLNKALSLCVVCRNELGLAQGELPVPLVAKP